LLLFAKLISPYLSRMGLGEGIYKFDKARVLIWRGHLFDMLLQAGNELAGWQEPVLEHNEGFHNHSPD